LQREAEQNQAISSAAGAGTPAPPVAGAPSP